MRSGIELYHTSVSMYTVLNAASAKMQCNRIIAEVHPILRGQMVDLVLKSFLGCYGFGGFGDGLCSDEAGEGCAV